MDEEATVKTRNSWHANILVDLILIYISYLPCGHPHQCCIVPASGGGEGLTGGGGGGWVHRTRLYTHAGLITQKKMKG